ncbi:DUF4870 domain-containing protein [Anoxybacteroides tepidamans]|uniref:DUF4870 domain-containing protein n=1 Tax=Anoxybacteroides tepidamans TaxID=265948 RepID=UPI000482F0DA|nr:DUF4870 domain-containing protein [Anoxybacillus tepidamans]
MDSSKLLAAACYFSVFFAPFLFPLVVYFVTTDVQVKGHAKRSLLSHLLPLVFFVIAVGSIALIAIVQNETFVVVPFIGMIVSGIVSFIVVVWNVVKGVKVLQEA